ncbi:MAG: dihydroorotate dehydrogenase [Candidatus Neomarinimicrobiota bacterium]|nr:MAG: dihydroorotate dehydrogenase [Candidatus Neomarinimicrobiota bacterium]
MVDLSIALGNKLSLSNPILTASGTFGYGDEISDIVDIGLYGGIVTKSLTLKPRKGNPPPRVVETPCGMINSIGLANIGVDSFLEGKSEFLRNYTGKVFVNIAGRTDLEYCEILKRLTEENWIDGFEINVSCPNVSEGGIEFGTDPKILRKLVLKLRDLTDKFLMIKLSPNVTDIRILAETLQEFGADAVSMINTVYGSAVDINTRKPLINSVIGGLSGPAIKPIAIANIIKAYQVIDIPIIGVGGISSGKDVIEFMLAGASAVQLGTVHFYNPLVINEILQFLKEYCLQNNILSIGDIIGKAEV